MVEVRDFSQFMAPWERELSKTETVEQVETPEMVMENAKEERLAQLGDVLNSRLVELLKDKPVLKFLVESLSKLLSKLSKLINLVPAVGDIKTGYEFKTGTELGTGRKLGPGERLNCLLSCSTGTFVLANCLMQNWEMAAIGEIFSNAVGKFDLIVHFLKEFAKKQEKANPRLAHLLDTLSDLAYDQRDVVGWVIGDYFKEVMQKVEMVRDVVTDFGTNLIDVEPEFKMVDNS